MLHELVTFLSMSLSPALAPGAAAPAPTVAVVAPVPVAPPLPPTPPVPAGTGSGSATPPSTASAADAMVGKVQAFYASVAQVTARFTQVVSNVTFGDTKTSTGKVFIQKPGKMRWDYYATGGAKTTVKKSFISNGTYLYVVEHDNKQVIKKDLSKDLMPVAVSFLYGKGDLRADFTAEVDTASGYGTKADTVLKLTPKKPTAQYKFLFLVVDPADAHVKASIIVDSAGNVNQIGFDASDFATPVKASWFEFDEKSVKSYRIVDGDAAASSAEPEGAPASGSGKASGSAAAGSGSASK